MLCSLARANGRPPDFLCMGGLIDGEYPTNASNRRHEPLLAPTGKSGAESTVFLASEM